MSKHHDSPFDQLAKAALSTGIPQEARLLVAVSGGPDSIALLHILHTLSSHRQSAELSSTQSPSTTLAEGNRTWQLAVGHVNHALRGAASDEDALFVRKLSQQLGLEAMIQRVDVPKYAEENSFSIEVAARELRWRCLRQMLLDWKGHFIVTGHTLSDQAETLLMRLLRGSGIVGLSGMKLNSGGILRPFLSLEHKSILEYLNGEGISYRTDSSNAAPDHLRNRIRMETFPKLMEIQPRVAQVLGRTSQLLAKDADFLLKEAYEALRLMDLGTQEDEISASRGCWLALHPALKGHTLRLLIERLMGNVVDVDEAHIALISTAIERGKGHAVVNALPRHLALYVDETRFTVRLGPRSGKEKLSSRTLHLPGQLDFEGGVMTAVLQEREAIDLEKLKAVCTQWHALCDADRLGESVTIRSRRPGDTMKPLGSPGRRKLKEIMIDRHIPREARDAFPVIEKGDSIVWVVGIALDQSVAVTEETKRVMHLTFMPPENLVMMLKYDCFLSRK